METKADQIVEALSDQEKAAIIYHNLFDFPLNFSDLIRWKVGAGVTGIKNSKLISKRNGFYFLEGKVGVVYKRLLHKRISAKKILIANRAAKIISRIPSVKMIAITGSLAMENSNEESDIDLMIITKRNLLWTTRAFVYLLISLWGIKKRRPFDSDQKDKLCLNMWMDESDLSWTKKERNIYTAHEIAQIVPLVNKDNTYEKLLNINRWVLKYWPNAVSCKPLAISDQRLEKKLLANYYSLITSYFEKLAFKLQKIYMNKKVTRELVTPTRALFHPQDWGKVVLGRLTS